MSGAPSAPTAADGESFARLLDGYAERIRRAVRHARLERHGIATDDVEQDVRLRVLQRLQQETMVDRPASYLERVIRSAIVDAIRRALTRGSGSAPDGDAIAQDTASPEPEPDHAAAHAQLVADARAILRELGTVRATAVGLLLQGFSIPEIARLTDVTESAARNMTYRALNELRLRLAEKGHELSD